VKAVAPALSAALSLASAAGAEESPRPWALRYAMTDRIAQCIVDRNRDAVDAWMGTLAGSVEEERIFRRLKPEFKLCFGRYDNGFRGNFNPTYDPAAIRQGLVNHLMKARHPTLPDTVPPSADPAWYRSGTDLQKNGERIATSIAVNDFGFCVIKSDWQGVRSLLQASTPAAEQKALARLLPLLGSCLPAKLKLRIDRDRLRAVIAESVFHMLSRGAGSVRVGATGRRVAPQELEGTI
jgi:hypothetical protein